MLTNERGFFTEDELPERDWEDPEETDEENEIDEIDEIDEADELWDLLCEIRMQVEYIDAMRRRKAEREAAERRGGS